MTGQESAADERRARRIEATRSARRLAEVSTPPLSSERQVPSGGDTPPGRAAARAGGTVAQLRSTKSSKCGAPQRQ
jgi:hypothetical protein